MQKERLMNHAQEALRQYNRIMDMLENDYSSSDIWLSLARFHYHAELLFKNDLENNGKLCMMVQNREAIAKELPLYFHDTFDYFRDNEDLEYCIANLRYTVFHMDYVFFRWVGLEALMDVIILLYLPDESIDSNNRDIIRRGEYAGADISNKYCNFTINYTGRLVAKPLCNYVEV
jgi:hypothetical protein